MARILITLVLVWLAAGCSHRHTVRSTADTVRTTTATTTSAASCTSVDTLAARAVRHDTLQHAVAGVVVKRGDTIAWQWTAVTVAAAEHRLHATEATRFEAAARTATADTSRYMEHEATVTANRPRASPWALVLAVVLAVALFFTLFNRNK